MKQSYNKQALCISIDAGWGFGKSFFLEKLSRELKDKGQIVVRFNAWENDISDEAFISFTDSLISGLRLYIDDEKFVSKANSIVEAFGKAAISEISDRIPLLEIIKSIVNKTQNEYVSIQDGKMGFFQSGVGKTRLEIVKDKVNDSLEYFFQSVNGNYQDKKVIILIDELDRCRPDFALQVLDRVKHLFPNPRLTFVFAINTTQLKQSISHFFGTLDHSSYFEKFFDFNFLLPEPNIEEFIHSSLRFQGNEKQNVYYTLLCQMVMDAEKGSISLRQIERMISHYNTVFQMFGNFDEITQTPYLIPVALFAKVIDENFFIKYFKKREYNFYLSGANTFKNQVYHRFVCFEDFRGEKSFELLPNVTEDDFMSRHGFGKYKTDEGNYLDIGNARTVKQASSKDVMTVYNLVASLS